MEKVSIDEAKPKEIPRFKFALANAHTILTCRKTICLTLHGAAYLHQFILFASNLFHNFECAHDGATLFDRRFQGLLAGRNLHIFPDQDEAGLSLYFELKKALPRLVYHQLPEGCKDLSEYYLKLRRREGMTLEEAKAKTQGCVSV